ncbi:leucine-rich repeat domain-containing protein, partial [Candidatus Bathyarchaeota archaeon]|nr:leucine-rich repeat domain-containing protein [Candidatus Bathyarchaeota archaeon]
GLTNLTSLELGSNRIREIENLDSLCALEELWLAKNKITEIKGLSKLPKLRLLSIQANRISDLSPLAEVPHLEELYISDNALESLAGLENNPKLRILEISNNKVASLEGLEPLEELEELWASYNLLADFGEVERVLGGKKGLTTVYFEGNPLQLRGPALYRNKVRLALPQLSQIDASMWPPPLFCSSRCQARCDSFQVANFCLSLRQGLMHHDPRRTRSSLGIYSCLNGLGCVCSSWLRIFWKTLGSPFLSASTRVLNHDSHHGVQCIYEKRGNCCSGRDHHIGAREFYTFATLRNKTRVSGDSNPSHLHLITPRMISSFSSIYPKYQGILLIHQI